MLNTKRLSWFAVSVLVFVQITLADLAGDVRGVLAEKVLAKATVGIEVVRLGEKPNECQIIYERNTHVPLTPASNMKVLTTSSALHTLGPSFKFRTILVKKGNDLQIWADGDPTLGDPEIGEQMAVFEDWAQQVRRLGVSAVDRVIVDDSVLDTEFLHPRWGKHRELSFGAELGGLNFNGNVLDFLVQAHKGSAASWSTKPQTSYVRVLSNSVTSGANAIQAPRQPDDPNAISLRGSVPGSCEFPVTIHDPSLYAATVFADLLKRQGITVNSVVRDRAARQQFTAATPEARAQWQTVRVSETPIETVIVRCNKKSVNLYAEALCKRQGAQASGTSGSWANGTATTTAFLKLLGVPESETHLDDGSGLSRENTITTNAMIRVLLHNFYSSSKDIFLKSLPIGGVDGTLERRFDPSLHGRVFAKTGYIASACSLSGYLQAQSGDWYAFCIIMNNMGEPVRPLQDRIVKAIDNASVAQ